MGATPLPDTLSLTDWKALFHIVWTSATNTGGGETPTITQDMAPNPPGACR